MKSVFNSSWFRARKCFNFKWREAVNSNKWNYLLSWNNFWNQHFPPYFCRSLDIKILDDIKRWPYIVRNCCVVVLFYLFSFCIISSNILQFALLFNLEIVKNYGPKVIINFLYNIKKGEKLIHNFLLSFNPW